MDSLLTLIGAPILDDPAALPRRIRNLAIGVVAILGIVQVVAILVRRRRSKSGDVPPLQEPEDEANEN